MFGGVYAIDQFIAGGLVTHKVYIVNTDTSKGPGKHWLAVYLPSTGIVEYFDPLGYEHLHSVRYYFQCLERSLV